MSSHTISLSKTVFTTLLFVQTAFHPEKQLRSATIYESQSCTTSPPLHDVRRLAPPSSRSRVGQADALRLSPPPRDVVALARLNDSPRLTALPKPVRQARHLNQKRETRCSGAGITHRLIEKELDRWESVPPIRHSTTWPNACKSNFNYIMWTYVVLV